MLQCKAELEHIHNPPSLTGECNVHRHLYYRSARSAEKTAYLEAVRASEQKDWKGFVVMAYLPRWKQIEEILEVDKILGRGKPDGINGNA
jgi:hypothetical protein